MGEDGRGDGGDDEGLKSMVLLLLVVFLLLFLLDSCSGAHMVCAAWFPG
jgi:hypothetical protein